MDEINKEKLLDAVYRKAIGYPTSETSEEYSLLDGQMTVTKQRITTKESPPDISAAKILLELFGGDDFSTLSDEELEKEKSRLLRELEKEVKAESKDKESNNYETCSGGEGQL